MLWVYFLKSLKYHERLWFFFFFCLGHEYVHIPGIFMGDIFCKPLKNHELTHHEKTCHWINGFFKMSLKSHELIFMEISLSWNGRFKDELGVKFFWGSSSKACRVNSLNKNDGAAYHYLLRKIDNYTDRQIEI